MRYWDVGHINTVKYIESAEVRLKLVTNAISDRGVEKHVHQQLAGFVAQSSWLNAQMPINVPLNANVQTSTDGHENPNNGIGDSALTAEQKQLDAQFDASRVAKRFQGNMPVENNILLGKADVQRTDMGTSISLLRLKPAKVIVISPNTDWCGKRLTALFQRATSYITSTVSKTTIGLRTWKRCLVKSTITAMMNMIGASWNSKMKCVA